MITSLISLIFFSNKYHITNRVTKHSNFWFEFDGVGDGLPGLLGLIGHFFLLRLMFLYHSFYFVFYELTFILLIYLFYMEMLFDQTRFYLISFEENYCLKCTSNYFGWISNTWLFCLNDLSFKLTTWKYIPNTLLLLGKKVHIYVYAYFVINFS